MPFTLHTLHWFGKCGHQYHSPSDSVMGCQGPVWFHPPSSLVHVHATGVSREGAGQYCAEKDVQEDINKERNTLLLVL